MICAACGRKTRKGEFLYVDWQDRELCLCSKRCKRKYEEDAPKLWVDVNQRGES